MVQTEQDIHIERVYRDKEWWGLQLEKLRNFYFDSLLPELACPRHRKGGIRDTSMYIFLYHYYYYYRCKVIL